MLIRFFTDYASRRTGVNHGVSLAARGAGGRRRRAVSAEDFYYLARCVVKDERHFDRFDRAFAAHFKVPRNCSRLWSRIPEEWLRRMGERHLSEEEKRRLSVRRLGQTDRDTNSGWKSRRAAPRREQMDRHRRHLAVRRRRLQPRRHSHRARRVAPPAAVKVWDEREYRNFDDNVELGTRNIKIALRKLRRFAREGAAENSILTAPSTRRRAMPACSI